jgi:hypothetical protein
MLRRYLGVLLALCAAAGGLRAEEYKEATIKGRGERGVVILQVKDKDVTVTPSLSMKAFDMDGKEFSKTGTDPKDVKGMFIAYRLLKEGNVVDVKTEKARDGKTEFIREIKLVKGELLPEGKATQEGGKTSKEEKGKAAAKGTTMEYKGAVVKKYQTPYLTLTVEDKEVKVIPSNSGMKAFDAQGQEVKKDRLRVLKEGNVVDVVTQKDGDKERVKEIKIVKGELLDKVK